MTFDDFWTKWPHKRGKFPAEKAFKKLKADEKDHAVRVVSQWVKEWRKENPQASHIHASTYLNQKRFLDIEEVSPEVEGDALEMWAGWITGGKGFLCKHIKPHAVQQMIERQMVTQDQCRDVGLI